VDRCAAGEDEKVEGVLGVAVRLGVGGGRGKWAG